MCMDPQSALAQLRDGKPAEDEALLDLGLIDLMAAKQAFEPRAGAKNIFGDDKPRSGLGPTQFVAEFSRLCGEDMAKQLSYLFMKIDCNSDGQVSQLLPGPPTRASTPCTSTPRTSSPHLSPHGLLRRSRGTSSSRTSCCRTRPSRSRWRKSCRRASSRRSCRVMTLGSATCTEIRSRTCSSYRRRSHT